MVLKRGRHFLPFLWTLSSSNHKTGSTGNVSEYFQARSSREQCREKEDSVWVCCAVKFMFSLWGWGAGVWIVPFSFHMPIKKRWGSRNNLAQASFCIWGNGGQRGNLLNRLWGEALTPPPSPSCIFVLLSLPKLLHMLPGPILWEGKATSKGNAAFLQGHCESLASGRTYLKSLRNILKLSRLGTRPSFALSFHRLIEFLDLNFSRFSQSVLFASSEALQSQHRLMPQTQSEDSGRCGSRAVSKTLRGLSRKRCPGKTPPTEHSPRAWHWEGAQTGWEDKPSTQSCGPGFHGAAWSSVQGGPLLR